MLEGLGLRLRVEVGVAGDSLFPGAAWVLWVWGGVFRVGCLGLGG